MRSRRMPSTWHWSPAWPLPWVILLDPLAQAALLRDYEMVSRSVTLPILMLGGEAKGDPTPMLNEFANGMKAGGNIRGALVGRNILYPGADDPMASAEAVHKIVHSGYSADQAAEYIMAERGKRMDALTKWIK